MRTITLCLVLLLAAPAGALDTDTLDTLVRAAVAESGFLRLDAAATWHALRRRSGKGGLPGDIGAMAMRYVSAFRVTPTPRVRWVMNLNEGCAEPEGWPSTLRWDRWAPKCARLYQDAEAFLAGRLADPCPGSTQWGSRTIAIDVRRAARAVADGRWIPAKCATQNAFFIERRQHQ